MNAVTLTREGTEDTALQQFAQETVQQWSEVCQRFLDRQRREILEQVPSPEKLQEHRAALKWMLRFVRAVYLTACDPDYPDRRMADELHGRLLQLEHSWRLIHDPMPEAEADQLLMEVFP
jgi:hypothetical protein